MSNRRALSGASPRRIDDCGQFVAFNRYALGEIFGASARRRDAGGDRLSDVAHFSGCERGIGRLPERIELRARFEHVQRFEIVDRVDVVLGAGRLADVAQAAMRNLAAHEGDVLHAGQPHIGDEHRFAGEMPRVFLAQETGADPSIVCVRVTTHPAFATPA